MLAVLEAQGFTDRKESEIGAEAELVHFRLSEKEAELSKRQLALEEKGLFAGDLNEQRIRCQSILQRLDSGMLVLEEKGRNMVSRLSDLRASIYNSRARSKAANSEFSEVSEKISQGQGRLKGLYEQLADLNKESEQAFKDKNQAEESFNHANSALRNHQNALDSTRINLAKTHDSLSSLEVEKSLLNDNLSQINEEYKGAQSILVERRSKLDSLEAKQNKANAESKLAKADIDKRVRLLDDRRQKLDKRREVLTTIQGELRGLEEIDRAFETASPALNWIQTHKDEFGGIIGKIADALKVKDDIDLPLNMTIKETETLIERLLGADLFGLMVEDSASAAQIAQKLLSGKERGAIALMPLDKSLKPQKMSTKGLRLLDYLDYISSDRELVTALLGDVYLVNSLDEAQEFHLIDSDGVRYVTKEGAVVWPNGKVTLGVQENDVDSVLARRRKFDLLSEELVNATALLSDAELETSTAEQNLQAAQQDDFEISQRLAKIQGDCESIREEVVRLEESMTQLLVRRESVERKLADVEIKRQNSEPLAEDFVARIAEFESNTQGMEDAVSDAEAELIRANERKNEIAERLSAIKIELETAKSSSVYLKSRHESLRKEIKELDQALEVSGQTEVSLDVIRQRVDPLYKLYEELHAGAAIWAEKLRDQAQLEQTTSKNLKTVIAEATAAVEEARSELAEINERLVELRVDKAKLESEVEHAINRITVENGVPLEIALETPSPEDRQSAEDQANRLRKKLTTIGPVNHVAMEEYEALKTRRDYTLEQIEDLREARKALAKIERALDKKMRNLFLETFEQVNKNFQEIFAVLFPGGFGQLLLIESDDASEYGIEVSAQPKGKKITKLSLMSGGEKSLTALALLFAVYKIRDVPFYILDEVEAALDDVNLGRLLEIYEELRVASQLLVITHQKRTMEIADALYGITMRSDGVTTVISQLKIPVNFIIPDRHITIAANHTIDNRSIIAN